jgi:hypothetical protein
MPLLPQECIRDDRVVSLSAKKSRYLESMERKENRLLWELCQEHFGITKGSIIKTVNGFYKVDSVTGAIGVNVMIWARIRYNKDYKIDVTPVTLPFIVPPISKAVTLDIINDRDKSSTFVCGFNSLGEFYNRNPDLTNSPTIGGFVGGIQVDANGWRDLDEGNNLEDFIATVILADGDGDEFLKKAAKKLRNKPAGLIVG